jgi:oxygen-dependent protoporphyrinogen oxidase
MRALVVGGGIGGLACGHRLRQQGVDATVLEAGARAGGKIRTDLAQGCLLEWGPQTCIAEPPFLALAAELGVEAIERPKTERQRFLVRDGRLVSPLGALSLPGILRALWGMIRKGPPAGEDESVLAYARRRFGDEAARRAFDPLVSGIYAGDPSRLAYASALAKFGKRRGASVTFRGGMAALPAAFARALGPALRLGAKARTVSREAAGFAVSLEGGERLLADALVLACPADAAADLLRPLDPVLAGELAAIRYEAVTAVSLVYDAGAFPRGAPRGFGFLAASEERLPILGCLYCPAPPGKVLLRPMLRGLGADADARAILAVASLLAPASGPELVRVAAHERGIPQYEAGHARRLRTIDERLLAIPGLSLAGNAYRGVAVPDVIEDARAVADAVARRAKLSAPALAPRMLTS